MDCRKDISTVDLICHTDREMKSGLDNDIHLSSIDRLYLKIWTSFSVSCALLISHQSLFLTVVVLLGSFIQITLYHSQLFSSFLHLIKWKCGCKFRVIVFYSFNLTMKSQYTFRVSCFNSSIFPKEKNSSLQWTVIFNWIKNYVNELHRSSKGMAHG